MRLLLTILPCMAVAVIVLAMLMHFDRSDTVTARYDCRILIGGWHPDVSNTIQQACRSRRNNADSQARN
jgi:hypothetical protein